MYTSFQHDWNISAWQATNPVFLKHFKDKLWLATNGKKYSQNQASKDLTADAICVIVLIAIFTVFAILGSLSNAYEFFYETNTKKKRRNNEGRSEIFYIDLSQKNMERKLQSDSTKYMGQSELENASGYEGDNEDYTNQSPSNIMEKNSVCEGWLKKIRTFLCCFCLAQNGKKLFQKNSDKEQFACLHGIRFISNFSIISFHIGMYYSLTSKNIDKVQPLLNSALSHYFINKSLAVNAFFTLSGFLNAYFFSKEYAKNNGQICWWYFYVKRFIRITPVYMIMLAIYTTLLNYDGSGPIWPEYNTNPVCKENWWWHLLYINNFQSSLQMCMLWGWYLAADMQLYVLSPIFLVSLLRWPRFGYSLASVTIFLSCLSCFIISEQYNLISITRISYYLHDLETFTDKFWLYVDKLYTKTYSRVNPYLIGLLLGFYFHKRNPKDIRNSLITSFCGWITAGILTGISVFALFYTKQSVLETALYHSIRDLFFSIGLSWFIYVCITGQGDFINSVLSWKLFLPLSKLSYCAFLIHMLIVQRDYQAAQVQEEFSYLSAGEYGIKVFCLTYVFSVPATLLFELPMINLLNLFKQKRRN